MNRNLNLEEKERIRDRYADHILYRLINLSYKRHESEMKVFRFSPEDVFIESLNVLDDLKAPNRDNDDLCDTIWDDLYCKFRDRGDNIPEEELNKAVGMVLSMVTYCLVLLNSMKYNGLVGKLDLLIQKRYRASFDMQLYVEVCVQKIGHHGVTHWIMEYMNCDSYMYDEIMDYLEEKDEEEEVNEEDFKYAPNKVRAKVLLEILEQCGLGLDQQDMTKVARLVGFIIGASSNSLRNNLTTGNGLILSDKQHGKHVEEVNKLLAEMKSKIKLKCE